MLHIRPPKGRREVGCAQWQGEQDPETAEHNPRQHEEEDQPVTAAILGLGIVFLSVVPAHATFHGTNGRIAYSLDTGSGAQIYTIKHDGTGRRQLTHVDGDAITPEWSPNGRKIVFELDHPNDHCSVELMNADGTHMRDLTGTAHPCDSSPAFMPGGRVLFTAEGGSGPIMSMNLEGGHRRVIFRSQLYKKEPQLSPDGRTVLFLVEKDLPKVHLGYEENVKALYSVRMNGTHLNTVVPFDFDVCACGGDWAPNGKRIVNPSGRAWGPRPK